MARAIDWPRFPQRLPGLGPCETARQRASALPNGHSSRGGTEGSCKLHFMPPGLAHRSEAGFSRGCAGPAGAARSAETGIARFMAPTGGNISVGPNFQYRGVDAAVA